jgi:hypothetical protein
VELHIILSEDRNSTLPVLAVRADQLWAHSTLKAIAGESGQEDPAGGAVSRFQYRRGRGSFGKPQCRCGGPAHGAG